MYYLKITMFGEEKALLEIERLKKGISASALTLLLKSRIVPYLQKITEESWPQGRIKKWPSRKKEVSWPLMEKTGELKGRLSRSPGDVIVGPNYAQVTYPSSKDVRDKYLFHQLGTVKMVDRPMVGLLPIEEVTIIALIENYARGLTI